MELAKEKYRDIDMNFNVDSKGMFTGNALDSLFSTNTQGTGFNTLSECREVLKNKVDEFVDNMPKTYKELADVIEGSLVWTCYEQCYVDEDALKIIIENFIKATKR